MIDSPRLPGLSSRKNVWSGCNLSCGITRDKCLGPSVPCVQLFEGIRLYLKFVFPASVENDIATKIGLENVVLLKNVGAELVEDRLRDYLAWDSQVHKQ